MNELKRDHRTLGIVRSEQDEYTILETDPGKFTAAPTRRLLPATPQDVAFDIRMALSAIVDRARFLGVPDDALRNLLDEEINHAAP